MDREQRDDIGASLSASPPWLRRAILIILTIANPIWKVGRAIILLQAVGGVVGIAIGIATLNATLIVAGLGQMLLAGLVLALNPTSEQVAEAVGPDGAFVLRAQRRQVWRDRKGWPAILALLRGERAWKVSVRRRQDDPFGATVAVHAVTTQKEAVSLQRQLERQLREGQQLRDGSGD